MNKKILIASDHAGFDLKLANDISSDEIETFRENLNITHPETRKENINLRRGAL